MVSIHTSAAHFYNPFGAMSSGRPYFIVLADTKYNIIATVVSGSNATQLNRDKWYFAENRSAVGRCIWTNSPCEMERDKDDLADLPKVVAGKYLLAVVVTRRLTPGSIERHIANQTWESKELDEPIVASCPIPVEVDVDGEYHPDGGGSFPEFNTLDVLAERIETPHTSVRSTRVLCLFNNPEAAWIVAPQLNLFASRERATHVRYVKEDGTEVRPRSPSRTAGSRIASVQYTDGVFVPRDGVIGGFLVYS